MIATIVIILILLAVLILVMWTISSYNSIIKLKNMGEEAEADVEAYMKKRFDLIPNLVETVKGYAKHESGTFEAVTKARNMAIGAHGIEEMDQANNVLTGTLKSLFALSEAYPELKANTNFQMLQSELSSIEEQILKSRKYYNGVARAFNDKVMVFPTSIIAHIFHFTKMAYVKVEEEAKTAPKVQF